MKGLIADAFLNDPMLAKAQEELLVILEKYKDKIIGIRPPQADLKLTYEQAIKRLGTLRGQDLFFPYIGSGIGNGALVELADGSIKYDFISGIGTHFGHCHPKILAACLKGNLQDLSMETNLQHNRDALELITLLTQHSGMDHCFLTTSGTMANENALKIIFQKKAPAYRILAFEGCFIGRSLALSQVSDRPHFREGLPINFHVDYVPFYDWRDPKGSQERALACLRQHLARYPNEHACMCFELIQGESGSYPGSRDFFEALMRLLKEKNIAVLVDEVQTFGRTDHLFAFQHFNLQNYIDVVTCGKLMHACATLFKAELRPKPALIAQTFLSATSLIQAALAILKSLLEDNFLGIHGKNLKMREHCIEHLQCLAHKYPHKLEGPFGYGLMVACTPFKGQKEQVVNFVRALFDAGLIVYTSGNNPTRLRMLIPAGGVTHEDIDQAFAIFEKILLTL